MHQSKLIGFCLSKLKRVMLQKIVASMIECFASDHLFQKGPKYLNGYIYIPNIKRLRESVKRKKKDEKGSGLTVSYKRLTLQNNLPRIRS